MDCLFFSILNLEVLVHQLGTLRSRQKLQIISKSVMNIVISAIREALDFVPFGFVSFQLNKAQIQNMTRPMYNIRSDQISYSVVSDSATP